MRKHKASLGRRDIYMLPTGQGVVFFFIVLALLLAAINYHNGLIFILCFLLVSIAVITMLYCHRNLSGIELNPGHCEPVFAGDEANFQVIIKNSGKYLRESLYAKQKGRENIHIKFPSPESTICHIKALGRKRGYLDMPGFHITSRFPLGLIYGWSRTIRLPQRCLIYPKPGAPIPPPQTTYPSKEDGISKPGESGDFIGLRKFQQTDPWQHIHWKHAAKSTELLIKQFGESEQSVVWLNWDMLPAMKKEERLSQLCRWVIDCEAAGYMYGLSIPGVTFDPEHGDAHKKRCLKALALFE